jgi:hypothetical protein
MKIAIVIACLALATLAAAHPTITYPHTRLVDLNNQADVLSAFNDFAVFVCHTQTIFFLSLLLPTYSHLHG